MADELESMESEFPAEFGVEFRQTSAGVRALAMLETERSMLITGNLDNMDVFCSPSIPQQCLRNCAGFLEQQLADTVSSITAAAASSEHEYRTTCRGGEYTVHIQFKRAHDGVASAARCTWSPLARARVTTLHASPGQAFARRVARLVTLKKLLLFTNAAISTLGGGHFLCGHLDAAAAMARRQLLVARALGDEQLFARVYMHYVYINLHSGHLDDALRIALRLRRHARASKDSELHGMATAAAVLIRRLLTLDHEALPEAATEVHAHDGAVVTKASDDFARYRSALAQRRQAGKSPRPA